MYFKWKSDFDINYPQEVTIKFVTYDAMYYAQATLQEIKKSDNRIYFSVIPPTKMIRQQKRKYARVELERSCVLAITDEYGRCTTYLTKSINLSACGILLHNLETLDSNDILKDKVEMSKHAWYNIVIFMEPDVVIKLFAMYVRHECINNSHRYAFRFFNTKQKDIDLIGKCITNEQLKLLKLQMRYK